MTIIVVVIIIIIILVVVVICIVTGNALWFKWRPATLRVPVFAAVVTVVIIIVFDLAIDTFSASLARF
jgi:hypothetical protein